MQEQAPETGNVSPASPLRAFRARRAEGKLKPDPAQELAAEKLESLHHALTHYRPETTEGGFMAGWKARLGLSRRPEDPPQGLYLYGAVGRGKSMLMDLFFESAPVEAKRRVHFHAFMAETHDRLHVWRKRYRGRKADPLPELAEEIAAETWLICFDEFHVVNVADAMILSRLFETLFALGTVVVATSNWPPDRLYEGGLQRARFLPFIELLKQRLDVLDLGEGTDYRLARLSDITVYRQPLGPRAAEELDRAFEQLTEGAQAKPDTLTVKGRIIPVPLTARGVARFSFAELCERPLGAEDYLKIATHFHTVILDGIPRIKKNLRNEARRFMTLVDALYEHRVKLICSADAPPRDIYPEGHGSVEFERTVSRLMEMQSEDYLDLPHLT